MPASVIDGKAIALEIQGEVAEQIKSRVAAGLRPPGLATILVGGDGASRIYVRNKRRACDAAGIRSFDHDLPGDTPQQALLELIDELKQNYTIVIVTHSMQQAARVSQKTAFFHLGNLVEFGPTGQIFTNPEDPRTESYITGRIG